MGIFRLALLLILLPSLLFAQDDPLRYRQRGTHNEGLRAKPVAGEDIALLSALIAGPSPTSWPDTLSLSFYLPADEAVHITVRQLRSRSSYYWLDEVRKAWTPRARNLYKWSTAPVLRQLKNLHLDELAALVRLDRDTASPRERVAPVLFTPLDFTHAPRELVYRFTFKTNAKAKLSAAVYPEGESRKLWSRPANTERAGSPFTLDWDSRDQAEGWYRLVLTGTFSADNGVLYQEVLFYHRPL